MEIISRQLILLSFLLTIIIVSYIMMAYKHLEDLHFDVQIRRK